MKNKLYFYELIVLFGLFILFLTPVIYHETLGEGASVSKLVSSFVYVLPVCFLLMCIRKRMIFVVIIIIAAITSFMETMMVLLYKNYLTSGNLLAVVTTTTDEGWGFFLSSLHEMPYTLPVIFGTFLAIYFYKSGFDTKKNLIFTSIFAVISIIFVTYQLQIKWKRNITPRFYIEQNLLGRPPYNFWFQAYNAYCQKRQREYIKDAKKMSFSAWRPKYVGKEIYVLIVGESLRFDNLSLCGYSRRTTPLLESLNNLVFYTNYYSTANLTMYSVPQIITRATPDDFVINYKEKSIIEPFRECGFNTFVICAGNLLNYETYLSDGCDSLLNLGDYDDDKIAEKIDSLSSIYEKTFFIVQFHGNHSPYKNFKKEQDKYHPNPVSDKVAWNNHEAMINAYDNTILFTDYNVYHIIKAIDKPNTQSAFMMVSDHGADYDTGVSDHGGNCNPRKAEYHVPLIFWYSTVWETNHKQKMEIFVSHKDKPVNADNIFYSVCDMADIVMSKKYAKTEWSLFSPKLKLHERRLLVPDGKNTIEVE